MRVPLQQLHQSRYIGDGLYVGHDGYQVWVIHHDGVETKDAIALDDATYEALVAYMSELKEVRHET